MAPKYLPVNENYKDVESIALNAQGLEVKRIKNGATITTVYPQAFEKSFEIKINGVMAGPDAGKIFIKIDGEPKPEKKLLRVPGVRRDVWA
jgi:hypothetical protein